MKKQYPSEEGSDMESSSLEQVETFSRSLSVGEGTIEFGSYGTFFSATQVSHFHKDALKCGASSTDIKMVNEVASPLPK